MTMGRKAYPSDLRGEQWERLAPLIPEPLPGGRAAEIERRELVNAILYVLRSGCPWRMLPYEYPARQTVYYYFRRWEREGVWDQVLRTLRMQLRQKEGWEAEPVNEITGWHSFLIIMVTLITDSFLNGSVPKLASKGLSRASERKRAILVLRQIIIKFCRHPGTTFTLCPNRNVYGSSAASLMK